MRVKDLIAELSRFDGDARVGVEFPVELLPEQLSNGEPCETPEGHAVAVEYRSMAFRVPVVIIAGNED